MTGEPCTNTIQPGEPLPGRREHYARTEPTKVKPKVSDHYAAAESAANAGQWQAAIAYFIGALVDELRKEEAGITVNFPPGVLDMSYIKPGWSINVVDEGER